MLKDDATLILFAHNLAKQPQKRSRGGEQISSKRQLYENVLHHNELMKSFEFDENTKQVQTELQCISVSCTISLEVTSSQLK